MVMSELKKWFDVFDVIDQKRQEELKEFQTELQNTKPDHILQIEDDDTCCECFFKTDEGVTSFIRHTKPNGEHVFRLQTRKFYSTELINALNSIVD